MRIDKYVIYGLYPVTTTMGLWDWVIEVTKIAQKYLSEEIEHPIIL